MGRSLNDLMFVLLCCNVVLYLIERSLKKDDRVSRILSGEHLFGQALVSVTTGRLVDQTSITTGGGTICAWRRILTVRI